MPAIKQTVDKFLADQSLTRQDIGRWLPPQTDHAFLRNLAGELDIDEDRMIVNQHRGVDAFTSSTPISMLAAADIPPGTLGLIINIGSGLQVGCALYRF